MPKIGVETAQRIVRRIGHIISFEVSILDVNGRVIASTNEANVGHTHNAAMRAVDRKEASIVYRDREDEKKGIYFPIRYNSGIAGVIEINGELDAVMQSGQMIYTIAELILENDSQNEASATKECRLNDFFYEWIHRGAEEYDDRFRDQAEYFKIRLDCKRVAVRVLLKKVRYSVMDEVKAVLGPDEYLVRQSIDDFMVLLIDDAHLKERVQRIMAISDDFSACYLGRAERIVSRSVETMEKVQHIAAAMVEERHIYAYEDMSLECAIADLESIGSVGKLERLLKEKDEDGVLRHTLEIYARYGEDVRKVCEKLFIHRNTLGYRLEKIFELTGKNPRNGRDLMLLYTACIRIRLEEAGNCASAQ